jgi:hypothetical protein
MAAVSVELTKALQKHKSDFTEALKKYVIALGQVASVLSVRTMAKEKTEEEEKAFVEAAQEHLKEMRSEFMNLQTCDFDLCEVFEKQLSE